MFSIEITPNNEILLSGRLDASQTEKAKEVLDKVTVSAVVNFKNLDYISSAGLGVLFAAQKRLRNSGKGLKLTNMNSHIRDVFRYARFELVFEIE
jgi:anti-sigma B factor antagonist